MAGPLSHLDEVLVDVLEAGVCLGAYEPAEKAGEPHDINLWLMETIPPEKSPSRRPDTHCTGDKVQPTDQESGSTWERRLTGRVVQWIGQEQRSKAPTQLAVSTGAAPPSWHNTQPRSCRHLARNKEGRSNRPRSTGREQA